MGDPEDRGRLERIRAAKRALRKFQQRREQEQGKRGSRTLRASVLLQGADAPTILTQSFKATNSPRSSARESALRAMDASRRRHSRTQSILSDANGPSSRRSSVRMSQQGPPGTRNARRSVHIRNPSVSLPSQLPPPASRRPSSIIFSNNSRSSVIGPTASSQLDPQARAGPADASKRRSRHSRQLSISTRRESFEVMSGRPMGSDSRASYRQSRAGRASVRFSTLEAASVLFNAGVMQKPLPPVPQEWCAGLWEGDNDEGQDRMSALEKLEGRSSHTKRPSTSAPRSETPSWLRPGGEPARSSPALAGAPWEAATPKDTPPVEESLDTLLEVDEEESMQRSRSHAEDAPHRTAEAVRPPKEKGLGEAKRLPTEPPSVEKQDPDSSSDTSRSLRPLRLSTLNSNGTPLLGATRRASTAPVKSARRASNIYYKPSHPAQVVQVEDIARGHQASSSRSAQSSNTSWPLTDAAGSGLFSPKSVSSDSPGRTSIDSNDQTPKRAPRPAQAPEPVLVRLQNELQCIRDRHLGEITELQREVEEVRQVMGAQLASVASARDAAQARVQELETDAAQMRERLEEAEGERDMHLEDVNGWRSRCSDLEQTIQSQQLRSKQEQSWRQAATKRMQTLTNRLKNHESSFDSNSSCSQLGPIGSFSSMSPEGASEHPLDAVPDLPALPEMPSDDEIGGWSMQVARQLSKHAPDNTRTQDLAPETIHLLSDMRQQIMGLYSELKLEQSNHELTRAQLREAKLAHDMQRSASQGSEPPVSTFTPADVQNEERGDAGETPALSTPSSRKQAASRRRRHAFLADDASFSYSSQEPAETTADVLFTSHSRAGSLVGLGLAPPRKSHAHDERADAPSRPEVVTSTKDEPAWPETVQDAAWLDEDHSWPSELQTDHAAHEPSRPSLQRTDSERLTEAVPGTEADAPLASSTSWLPSADAAVDRPQETPPTDLPDADHTHDTSLEQATPRPTDAAFSQECPREAPAAPATETVPEPAPAPEPQPDLGAAPEAEAPAAEAAPVEADSVDTLFAPAGDRASRGGVRESIGALFDSVSAKPSAFDELAEVGEPEKPKEPVAVVPQEAPELDIESAAIEIPANVTKDALEMSPDLEAGDESAWVDEDEPETPEYARPEFIPEWSFEQAMFEAAQDVRVYELSGRKPCSKQSRRGAARVHPPLVEDFFGILNADELKPALPMPSYALDMPPFDPNKLHAQPPVRSAAVHAPQALNAGRSLRSVLGRSAYVDESAPLPPPTTLSMPMSDTVYPEHEPLGGEEGKASNASPFLTQMFSSLKSPWLASEKPVARDDYETQYTSTPEIASAAAFSPKQDTLSSYSPPWPTTPTFSTMDHLAPSIPPPSTPVPRSPETRLASPNSAGQRFIRPDAQTRIPVPTPVWRLNFTLTTATPQARPPFTI
ncbi:hypothetical protein MOBT1_000531 [Malassezia obtusa]|uniref:Uncharacterized protein n=1 Tax=Malassezia obtusa TaxID=76774 RepID=A0AAF0IVB8_9BASI|nr:hypothetical protein MOBT1_000531 [Malassezia obtusa]